MFWCVSCTAIVLTVCFQYTKASQVLTDDFPLAKGSVQLANSCSKDAADIGIQGSLSADFTLNPCSCCGISTVWELHPWDSITHPHASTEVLVLISGQSCTVCVPCYCTASDVLQNWASHLWFMYLWREKNHGRQTTQIRQHSLTLGLTASRLLKNEIWWVKQTLQLQLQPFFHCKDTPCVWRFF